MVGGGLFKCLICDLYVMFSCAFVCDCNITRSTLVGMTSILTLKLFFSIEK